MPLFKIHHLKYKTLRSLSRLDQCDMSPQMIERKNEVNQHFEVLTERDRLRARYRYDRQKDAGHIDIPEQQSLWEDIGLAANWLFDNGWYEHVADVNARNGQMAVRETTSIDKYWWLTGRHEIVSVPTRSTNNLDIIEVAGGRFLWIGIAFYDLQEMDWIRRKAS